MHSAKILGALSLFLLLTSVSSAEKVPVLTQFKEKIASLEASLKAEKNISKRYDLFLSAHADLVKLRKSNPRQDETAELSMSLFMDTLNDLPPKKKFSPKKCPEYVQKAKAMTNIAHKDPEQTEDPMIARAVSVAELICD